MSETELSKQIAKLLDSYGWPNTRLQCGKIKQFGRYIHLSKPGFPDRIAICPSGPNRGRFVGFEIKTVEGAKRKQGKTVSAQNKVASEIIEAGGFYCRLMTLEVAAVILNAMLDGSYVQTNTGD